MDVNNHGFQLGHNVRWHGLRMAMMQRAAEMSDMSRADKFIMRNDGNGDGKISASEMADSRLGRRMSVETFAQLDGNGDGMLEAGELQGVKRNPMSTAAREEAMRERYAEMLTRPASAEELASDVAGRVVGRLDADGSGGIDSEELAGSYLGELVGDGFYELDADKNGVLDQSEIAGFVHNFLTSLAEPAEEVVIDEESVVPVSDGETEVVSDVAGDVAGVSPEVVGAVESAFEAALEILQNAEDGGDPVSVVEQLYGQVQDILSEA